MALDSQAPLIQDLGVFSARLSLLSQNERDENDTPIR